MTTKIKLKAGVDTEEAIEDLAIVLEMARLVLINPDHPILNKKNILLIIGEALDNCEEVEIQNPK